MRRLKQITRNNVNEFDSYIDYEEVNECPICKAKIAPIFIASSLDTNNSASIFNFCRNCKDTFVSKYSICKDGRTTPRTQYYKTDSLIYSEPNRFAKQEFDQKISDLSSQFVKIYNQALAAESSGLDEIAGLGYRKALEFLIKDYAIHEYPDEAESIKSKPLAQCIKNYISADNIKTLAERSTWIGNDEAHYIRKQEDRDVSDMKAFIQAIVYFTGMILITEDAASMAPKK
ncbi:MAG TPA: DUF4145 domain-containing protein [Candidatus Mediterraneibacter intestinigallinarum]|nr:DUF4145 domain-containing protein [Candidatus Mediterraneibacter intestinigallinarum]